MVAKEIDVRRPQDLGRVGLLDAVTLGERAVHHKCLWRKLLDMLRYLNSPGTGRRILAFDAVLQFIAGLPSQHIWIIAIALSSDRVYPIQQIGHELLKTEAQRSCSVSLPSAR